MAKRAREAGTLAALTDGGLPLERLMLETDAPFMAPDKYVRVQCDASLLPKSTVYRVVSWYDSKRRNWISAGCGIGGRKNEPAALPAVCRAVAAALGVSFIVS